ncbi:DNA topoisomerase 1 [Chelonia mydas]|uniref:DNA topoisomerase I n=1 Tax=Chelonia mydas TaxID=8469 RepID=M7BK01_CHEMY|nr:DNA topoisomerase 1 [Chelonia mydas]
MSGDQLHNDSQIEADFRANVKFLLGGDPVLDQAQDSHKHKDKHKDREHRHKEHKKDKEKDREKSKHSNSEHKDSSEKKHKEKEKTKHKDGSSEKHKDKHKDRDKEKRKEEKSKSSGDIKIKKEKENGFSSPPRIKDEPDDDGYYASPKEDSKPLKRPREEDDDEYKPKKIKTEDIKKSKKRKQEEEEDNKAKKTKSKDKKVPEGDNKKKKQKKEEEQKWKWWEEERYPEGIKWKFLEHKGPVFAPPYEPLPENVKFYYDGKVMKLSPKAEEVATFFAKMLDHEYTTKDIFRKNFFKDWRKEMTSEEKSTITNLNKCDFSQMSQYFKAQSEARKQMSKEEKQKIKEENERLLKEYGFCIMDNHKERIANFKIEPPGLFRGRGNHPKMGMLKRRIMPEDIIINCSKDSKVPPPPPGHKWKEVRYDNKVTWLVSWTENIQGSIKYIMLNPSSRIKGEKDWQKYETARRLKKCVDKIRNQYREDWKSKEMKVRQRAVALYFIDKLALRAGNEKEEGETADTVGCCSLRVEHINLHPELDGQEYMVEFDFLGKDSIRYYNKVPVEKRVFKNLQLFMENKQPEDDLFDRLNTSILNKHLQDLMEGLTAKVFRTYNASITLQQQLKELTTPDDNIPAKILSYNRANRAVAILCNHQRAPPKTFEKSMMNLQTKIDAKKDQLADARRELKSAKADAKVRRDEKSKKTVESKKKAVQRIEEQLMKLEVQATDREENKQIALGTSKLNYLDPRISVACLSSPCHQHSERRGCELLPGSTAVGLSPGGQCSCQTCCSEWHEVSSTQPHSLGQKVDSFAALQFCISSDQALLAKYDFNNCAQLAEFLEDLLQDKQWRFQALVEESCLTAKNLCATEVINRLRKTDILAVRSEGSQVPYCLRRRQTKIHQIQTAATSSYWPLTCSILVPDPSSICGSRFQHHLSRNNFLGLSLARDRN